MEPGHLTVEAGVGHQIAAWGGHDTWRLDAVLVAVTSEPGIDRHPKPLPRSTGRLDRSQDPSGGAVMARIPHAQAVPGLLQDPRPQRPQVVGRVRRRRGERHSLPGPFHRTAPSLLSPPSRLPVAALLRP